MRRLEEIEMRLEAATPGRRFVMEKGAAGRRHSWMICGEGGVLADMRVYPGNGDDALLFADAPAYIRDLLALAHAARALQMADRRHCLAVEPEVEIALGALFAALAPLLEEGEEGDG